MLWLHHHHLLQQQDQQQQQHPEGRGVVPGQPSKPSCYDFWHFRDGVQQHKVCTGPKTLPAATYITNVRALYFKTKDLYGAYIPSIGLPLRI